MGQLRVERMLRGLRSDDGFTIVEASVSIVIMGILLAAVYSVIIRVNQDATEQIHLSDTLGELRLVAQDIDVELRQATADTDRGSPVQLLAWNEIQFLSYLNASSDLQLHRYWLQGDCTTGCDLLKAVYARIPSSDPPAYQSTPEFTQTMATGILAAPASPLLVGQVWSGASLTTIPACDESGSIDCDFALVEVSLRSDPTEFGAVPEVVVTEQVRIRNAR